MKAPLHMRSEYTSGMKEPIRVSYAILIFSDGIRQCLPACKSFVDVQVGGIIGLSRLPVTKKRIRQEGVYG